MSVAGQELGAMRQIGRINDGVRRSQSVLRPARSSAADEAMTMPRSATTHVSVKAITRSALSSLTSHVSHLVNSSCTRVGASHYARPGNSTERAACRNRQDDRHAGQPIELGGRNHQHRAMALLLVAGGRIERDNIDVAA